MQKITKKRFFDLIIGGASAKIGAPRYSGNAEINDAVVARLANDVKDVKEEKFRKVVHRQSNAIKFEDDSWLFFDKPKNCDSRKAYLYEIKGETYVSLIDHRPAYNNAFGISIREQTIVLIYKLAK